MSSFSAATSKQLNVVSYLRGVHEACSLENVSAVHTYCLLVNLRFHACTSLIPRLITVVFGLGMRKHMCMYTTLGECSALWGDRA